MSTPSLTFPLHLSIGYQNARNLLFLALGNWVVAFLGEPARRTAHATPSMNL